MLFLVGLHLAALEYFQAQSATVNKVAGTIMQIVGGLIILHSVDSNLGIFRNQSLFRIIIAWLRDFPVFKRTISLSANLTGSMSLSGSISTLVKRAVTTVEERLAEAERQIVELRADLHAKHQALQTRIEQVKTDLSASITSNQTDLKRLSEQIEKATVGSFKQQAFGVMLAVYGAATSLFA
jgi:hypothetical protein